MHIYTAPSGAISLTGGTAKTAIQLVTPGTRRAKLLEVGLSLGDTTATHASGLVEFRHQSDAGVGGAGITMEPVDLADPAALCSGLTGFTTEPTDAAEVFPPMLLTPVGSLLVFRFPYGEELALPISYRLGLRLNFPDSQTLVRAWAKYQE